MNDLITDRPAPEGGQGPASVWGMGQVAGGIGQLLPENGRKTDARLRGLRDWAARLPRRLFAGASVAEFEFYPGFHPLRSPGGRAGAVHHGD